MTRKEAAGVIKFEKACVLRQDTPRCNRDCKKCDLLLPTEDVLTAYDMAIKALEQQPCEDTISRQAAIDAVRTYYDDEYALADSIEELIEKLPSAQPEWKRGKWEIYVISMFDGEGCRCSECGLEGVPYWDFCPNCGANMREVSK